MATPNFDTQIVARLNFPKEITTIVLEKGRPVVVITKAGKVFEACPGCWAHGAVFEVRGLKGKVECNEPRCEICGGKGYLKKKDKKT